MRMGSTGSERFSGLRRLPEGLGSEGRGAEGSQGSGGPQRAPTGVWRNSRRVREACGGPLEALEGSKRPQCSEGLRQSSGGGVADSGGLNVRSPAASAGVAARAGSVGQAVVAAVTASAQQHDMGVEQHLSDAERMHGLYAGCRGRARAARGAA